MAQRFPQLEPANFTPRQKEVADAIQSGPRGGAIAQPRQEQLASDPRRIADPGPLETADPTFHVRRGDRGIRREVERRPHAVRRRRMLRRALLVGLGLALAAGVCFGTPFVGMAVVALLGAR